MDKLERMYLLHRLLDGRRAAVSLDRIAQHLECSPATAKRAIREFRTRLDAPLAYDRTRGGYHYAEREGQARFELPGLWFGAEELAALVTLREMLARLEPGLLGEALEPLSRRLSEIMARRSVGLGRETRRIRVISQHARAPGASFSRVAEAVLARRVLEFRYARRTDGEATLRRVCPQRLTRYRGCWYLDAWCHDRQALRSFAVERIADPRLHRDRPRDVPDADLDAHYADAYGIFAGPATATAVLRVAPRLAAWVADEAWHPRQAGTHLADGSYELRVPYGRAEELIRDILRLGEDVEVLEPDGLRSEVARRVLKMERLYRGRGRH